LGVLVKNAADSFPVASLAVLKAATQGLRCCCGTWMELKNCADCYSNTGGVRCDFTGESVVSESVWHCPRAKEAGIHPYGHDIDAGSTQACKQFQMQLRLEARVLRRMEEPEHPEECQRLDTRHKDLARALVPAAMVGFSNLKDDLSRLSQESLEPAPELQAQLALFRSILATEDWGQQYESAQAAAEGLLAHVLDKMGQLSHDAVRFEDEDDRVVQLEHLDAQFDGATMHREFEAKLEALQKRTELLKEFDGLEAVDVEAEDNRVIINDISQRILRVMVGSMPPVMQTAVTSAVAEAAWTPQGLKVTCNLAVGAQRVCLDQTIPFDGRDMAHARLTKRMAEIYQECKERLASLKQCSTREDLASCVEIFEVDNDDLDMCVVCQDPLCCGEKATRLRSCGHCFHEECIEGWLLGCKRECPVCKMQLHPGRVYAVGSWAKFVNLRARSDINGRRGRIVGWHSEQQRYTIGHRRDDGTEEYVAVKAINLVPCTPRLHPSGDNDTPSPGQLEDIPHDTPAMTVPFVTIGGRLISHPVEDDGDWTSDDDAEFRPDIDEPTQRSQPDAFVRGLQAVGGFLAESIVQLF